MKFARPSPGLHNLQTSWIIFIYQTLNGHGMHAENVQSKTNVLLLACIKACSETPSYIGFFLYDLFNQK